VQHKLTLMRSKDTATGQFRQLLREIGLPNDDGVIFHLAWCFREAPRLAQDAGNARICRRPRPA
jgi:hypothetical protein